MQKFSDILNKRYMGSESSVKSQIRHGNLESSRQLVEKKIKLDVEKIFCTEQWLSSREIKRSTYMSIFRYMALDALKNPNHLTAKEIDDIVFATKTSRHTVINAQQWLAHNNFIRRTDWRIGKTGKIVVHQIVDMGDFVPDDVSVNVRIQQIRELYPSKDKYMIDKGFNIEQQWNIARKALEQSCLSVNEMNELIRCLKHAKSINYDIWAFPKTFIKERRWIALLHEFGLSVGETNKKDFNPSSQYGSPGLYTREKSKDGLTSSA